MIADIQAVMWKEAKEILRMGGSRGWLNLLIIIGVFGVWLPWQTGPSWVESPLTLLYWAWLPLFLVTGVIADSFAGERERRTLETLLASRLSDTAILLGKVAAGVAYGWGLTLVSLMVGIVTVNIVSDSGRILMYSPGVALSIIVVSLLTAGLVAGAGVLVSLRAATVRQAAQGLSIAIMVLLFVPVFSIQALPMEWKARLMESTIMGGTVWIMLAIVAILALLDGLLLVAARARFQRARLILD